MQRAPLTLGDVARAFVLVVSLIVMVVVFSVSATFVFVCIGVSKVFVDWPVKLWQLRGRRARNKDRGR